MDNDDKKRSGTISRQMFKLCSSILVPVMIGLKTLAVSVVQLYIASEERKQDLRIADKRRWDTILATYIREMSGILTKHQVSSKKIDPFLAVVVRAKTLIACRQLDTERKAWLIQFLYESGTITVEQNPIDMRDAYLDGIDLSTTVFNSIQQASLSRISLSGASLINASFNERYLHGANFSGCTMLGASFRRAKLDYATFQKASLRDAHFTGASMKQVNFVWSDLRRSNLNDNQLHRASSFYLTVLPNGTFGRHLNLLKNGNAEQELFCSSTHLTRIMWAL